MELFDDAILEINDESFDFNSDGIDTDFDINEYTLNNSEVPLYNTSFQGSQTSDGFIYEGKINLERTISGKADRFEHYTKDGNDYVKVGNDFIRVDKGQTIEINNVKYDTI